MRDRNHRTAIESQSIPSRPAPTPVYGESINRKDSTDPHRVERLADGRFPKGTRQRKDFDALIARVGIWVTDIDEGVTLVFDAGRLTVYNGLEPRRTITIRAEAETVMSLSNLKIGILGLPVYYDEVGRGVASKLVLGRLKIDGLLPNIATLNRVTRIFSVH